MKLSRLLPIAAIVSCTPALAADPAFVGTWSSNAAQCKTPQERQGAPMIMTAKGYDQHEAHCRFVSVKKVRAGWRMATTCTVEGNQQREKLKAKVTGTNLTLTSGKATRTLQRCA